MREEEKCREMESGSTKSRVMKEEIYRRNIMKAIIKARLCS